MLPLDDLANISRANGNLPKRYPDLGLSRCCAFVLDRLLATRLMRFGLIGLGLICLGLTFGYGSPIAAQDPFDLPRWMDQNPKYTPPPVEIKLPDRLIPLWIEALQSRNVTMQRNAAAAIVIAQRKGFHDALAPVSPVLLERLNQQELDDSVRVAIAQACVALDLKAAADRFQELTGQTANLDLQAVIQPALAQWKHEPMGPKWKEQLAATETEPALRILAIQGLAALGDASVVPTLKEVVAEPANPYAVRYAAAEAIGRLPAADVIEEATRLQNSSRSVERILAARLLHHHETPAGIRLLLQLAEDPDSVVCSIAWENLLDSAEFRQLDPLVDGAIENREPRVRSSVVELLSRWESPAACEKLGPLMSDLHPRVRNAAREVLLDFAKQESLRPLVLQTALERLAGNWQGIQQSLLLLTELDHKPAATQLLPLLDHQRAEVHITAGWGLERLSVEETFQPAFEWAEDRVIQIKSGGSNNYRPSEYECLAHVIQLLGKNRYRPLEKEIIPRLIPKDISILEYPIRPAAIWSLGQIYQSEALPADLQKLLLDRLLDENPNDPESLYVKTMCAHVFGLTNAEATIPSLEKYGLRAGNSTRFGFYCNWALQQLDGRPLPETVTITRIDADWFLVPLERE